MIFNCQYFPYTYPYSNYNLPEEDSLDTMGGKKSLNIEKIDREIKKLARDLKKSFGYEENF